METIPSRVIRRSMTLAVAAFVSLTVFTTATTGANLSGLLLSLKFNMVDIGLMTSLTLLFPPLQIAGAMLQQRYFHRKRFVIAVSAVQYLLFLALAAMVWNWSLMPFAVASVVFAAVFALGQGVMQLPQPAYLAWLGDLVPARESNNFWNRRQSWSLVSTLAAGVGTGFLVDRLGNGDSRTYAVVLVIGCVFAFLSLWLTSVPPDPDPQPAGRGRPFLQSLREIWSNRSFRILVFFFSAWNVSNYITVPFIFVYLQGPQNPGDAVMGFDMTTIQILCALSGVVGFLSGYLFRVLGNNYGRKPVLILCAALKILEFVFWATMHPAWGVASALPAFLLGGFVNNGVMATQFSLLTTSCDKRNQSMAIAVFFAVTGIAAAVTSGVSGVLYEHICAASAAGALLPAWTGAAGAFFTPFNVLAMISTVCFVFSVFLLPLLREDGAAPTAQVVRVLLAHNPFRSVYQAHVLARPLSESFRVKTILAARSGLVASELARDLHSPSSRVRAEAVRNLATVGENVDAAVMEELVKLLEQPELGLQPQAAEALGLRRYAPALPALCRHALGDEGPLARTCVWAAGQVDPGPAAAAFMRSLLHDPKRRPVWPEAAEALGRCGDFHDAETVAAAFAAEDNLVLRRQYLLALSRLMVGDRAGVHPVFEAEDRERGSELDKVLRRVCEAERPGMGNGAAAERFAALRRDCEEEKYARCLESLLPPVLAAYGVTADSAPGPECLDRLFVGGQLRPAFRQREDYTGANLALQLRLWAKLKYEDNPDGDFLLLTALLALDALERNVNPYPVH